ncbi:MAG TPA: ATP-binding protein [Kofleriaceae bacterium]|jgi:chemotaxis protein histidine kinase CheA
MRERWPKVDASIELELADVERVYGLLDQLQVGFLLIGGNDRVLHDSFSARRMIPRSALAGTASALLGPEIHAELVAPILSGRSAGGKWREAQLPSRDSGEPMHVSVRSSAVRMPDGDTAALLAIVDVSAEVTLQQQYKLLIDGQKEQNEQLRRQIAAVLREHEDDLAQFNEILQLAPTIFASFIAEASNAVDETGRLAQGGGDAEAMSSALREVHTLKGNARSLGLNFIGGRAHAVEELLVRARDRGGVPPSGDSALGELADDLGRALQRASALRRRLGEHGVESTPAARAESLRVLAEVGSKLSEALDRIDAGHPARAAVAEAHAAFTSLTGLPLEHLFEYLRATAIRVAENEGREPPLIDVSGGGIAVPPAVYHALSQALPHLVRNAVCHGIEPPAERASRGKSMIGHISLVARQDGPDLQVWVRDDGRGLDRGALRRKAELLGVLDELVDDEQLDALLFRPGLSTSEQTTLERGRGMGAEAARRAIEEIGGTIAVWSRPGGGVEFAITIPTQ